MKIRVLVVAVAATASLVACGGEDPQPASTGNGPDGKTRKAMLDFARCMRQNGVDMPDPSFDGGRVTMRQGRTNADVARKAEKACAKYRESIKPPSMTDEDKEKFQRQALENARCMRAHGIDKFPDPTFDENGGAQVRMGPGMNPESAKFKAAQKACESTMPGFGTTRSDGEK